MEGGILSSREWTSPQRPSVFPFPSLRRAVRVCFLFFFFFSFPNGSACMASTQCPRWKAGVAHAVEGRDVKAPSSEAEACGAAGRSFGLRAETHGARGRGGR